MIKLLLLEFKKCKRRGIMLVLILLLAAEILYFLSSFSSQYMRNEQGWLSIMFYLTELNSIMLPTVCAVLASRIIDIEHKGNTLKLLETILPKNKIYFSKVLIGLLFLFHTLFLCYFFMPALIGIYCGVLWMYEHMGTNFNHLMVNSSSWKIMGGKVLSASFVGMVTIVWIAVLYIVCGRLAGIGKPVPSELLNWILGFYLLGVVYLERSDVVTQG